MNRKGQALVEFVLILPVFILILFTTIDFGTILTNKNSLESTSTDIIRAIKNGTSETELKNNYKNITIDISNYQEKYQKVIIKKKVRINTPGLDRILGNPYQIEIERIIPKDEQ